MPRRPQANFNSVEHNRLLLLNKLALCASDAQPLQAFGSIPLPPEGGAFNRSVLCRAWFVPSGSLALVWDAVSMKTAFIGFSPIVFSHFVRNTDAAIPNAFPM